MVWFAKYRFLIGLVTIGLLAFGLQHFYFKAQILTVERDTAEAARVLAEGQAEAIRRESILISDALNKAREADNERSKFYTDTRIQIERGRQTGDGPAAAVLRDTADRLRERYRAGQAAGTYP